MRISQVRFERTKSEPGYNNTKIGVTVDLNDGEDPVQALRSCRHFVKRELGELPSPSQLEHAKCIISECEGHDQMFYNELEK